MLAFFAISTVMSAQQSSCTITSDGDSTTRVYDGLARVIFNGDSVTIVNRRTGEVLDNIAIEGNRVGVRCTRLRAGVSNPTTVATPSTPSTTRVRPVFSGTRRSGGSSSGGGFPASAALGLPN